MTTPIFSIPEIASGQTNKYITHNNALRYLEAMSFRVLSRTNGGPPGSPADGDSYIVDSATGAWSGFSVNDLVFNNNGTWTGITPVEGITLWVNNENTKITYDGSSWVNTQPYVVALTYDGKPSAGQTVLRHPLPIAATFPSGLTNSQFVSGVACTATATFTIKKNAGSIGSIEFAASSATGTVTFGSSQSFAIGDKLTITAPSPQDATLANLGFSMVGTR